MRRGRFPQVVSYQPFSTHHSPPIISLLWRYLVFFAVREHCEDDALRPQERPSNNVERGGQYCTCARARRPLWPLWPGHRSHWHCGVRPRTAEDRPGSDGHRLAATLICSLVSVSATLLKAGTRWTYVF